MQTSTLQKRTSHSWLMHFIIGNRCTPHSHLISQRTQLNLLLLKLHLQNKRKRRSQRKNLKNRKKILHYLLLPLKVYKLSSSNNKLKMIRMLTSKNLWICKSNRYFKLQVKEAIEVELVEEVDPFLVVHLQTDLLIQMQWFNIFNQWLRVPVCNRFKVLHLSLKWKLLFQLKNLSQVNSSQSISTHKDSHLLLPKRSTSSKSTLSLTRWLNQLQKK